MGGFIMNMKKRALSLIFATMFAASALTGCSQPASNGTPAKTAGSAIDGNEVAIEKAAIDLSKNTAKGGYSLVSTDEMKKLVDEKKDMIVIDTMPADFYAKGHIPGALNAELPKTGLKDATDEQKQAFIKLLGTDKNKTIVVYCGFVACNRSDAGALLAMENGFKNVVRYPGGIIAWTDAKYETQK
jgi:thiosulfate/3-mercaptopyruvate sulfurtransferase